MSQITKYALANSLKKQLASKPLDKITINDITDDCGINRMTFYYHFKDIYDLLEWYFLVEGEKILKDKKSYFTWQEGFLALLVNMKENKSFIINVYHSIRKEYLENYIYNWTYSLLYDVIVEQSATMTIKDEDKKFVANFYKYAFAGLVFDWVKTNMREEPEELINKLSTLMDKTLIHSLENFKF